MTEAIAMQETNPVALDYRPLFNERTSYGAYLLPGLLMLILQQTLLIGLAASMARERQEQTFRELYQLAGNRFTTAFAGKGAFYFILYGIYALFFLTVNFSILQLPDKGRLFFTGAADRAFHCHTDTDGALAGIFVQDHFTGCSTVGIFHLSIFPDHRLCMAL